jgi:hypothetical protein
VDPTSTPPSVPSVTWPALPSLTLPAISLSGAPWPVLSLPGLPTPTLSLPALPLPDLPLPDLPLLGGGSPVPPSLPELPELLGEAVAVEIVIRYGDETVARWR